MEDAIQESRGSLETLINLVRYAGVFQVWGDMKGGLEQEYKYTNWIQDVRSRWLGWHTQGSETEIVMQIDSMFPPVLVARLCAFIDQVARWYTAPEEFSRHDASPRYFRLDYILMSLRPSVQSLD